MWRPELTLWYQEKRSGSDVCSDGADFSCTSLPAAMSFASVITSKYRGTFLLYPYVCLVGQDSIVGMAICYGLDTPGFESRRGVRFSPLVQIGSGAEPAACTMGTGHFTCLCMPK
jgi:hypothetical protein